MATSCWRHPESKTDPALEAEAMARPAPALPTPAAEYSRNWPHPPLFFLTTGITCRIRSFWPIFGQFFCCIALRLSSINNSPTVSKQYTRGKAVTEDFCLFFFSFYSSRFAGRGNNALQKSAITQNAMCKDTGLQRHLTQR